MTPVTLEQWLDRLERLHPREIDLGLERVARVAGAMALAPGPTPVLTVGGTNGKGSCVAYLEAMLGGAGYRVGAYTSPHLLRYNERVRIDGREASDEALVAGFGAVDAARGAVSLTYFEFGTLAAAALFREAGCEVWLLEVGLGGRLDAVNIFHPDVAVITSVGLDHQDWLGPDVASIGREKAGIFRAGCPAVFGGLLLPDSIEDAARALGVRLKRFGREFGCRRCRRGWTWWGEGEELTALPVPAMAGEAMLRNASSALMAICTGGLRLERAAVERALTTVQVPGRFQVLPGAPEWILDVAHNPDAAAELAANLAARPCTGRTLAVFGMLADKNAEDVSAALTDCIDVWYAVGLAGSRGLDADSLARRIVGPPAAEVRICRSIEEACTRAEQAARSQDRIVVFGSFRLVGPVLERLYSRACGSREQHG